MRKTACALVLAIATAACVSPLAAPVPAGTPTSPPSPVAPTSWVVYFARDLASPLAVTIAGPLPRATPELRLRQRLELLAGAPRSTDGGGFNVLPALRARLDTVTVTADLATLDYAVPADGWGVDGAAMARAFMQQATFTVTEESGIKRVLVTQNGGGEAVIGHDGAFRAPQTRAGLGYDGLMPRQAARVITMSVTGARPVLIPSAIPDGWSAAVRAEANAFLVTYSDGDGQRSVTLAIRLRADPPPGAAVSTPSFRRDAGARYVVAVPNDPRSERELSWTEPGTWSLPGSGGVPYAFSATGLLDAEFWRIASSLQATQP